MTSSSQSQLLALELLIIDLVPLMWHDRECCSILTLAHLAIYGYMHMTLFSRRKGPWVILNTFWLIIYLPSVKRSEEPKSVYVGGDYRCQADSDKTHIALAFEVPGGWYEEKTAIIATVLQVDIYSLSRKWKELVDKARAKQLQPHEYNSGFQKIMASAYNFATASDMYCQDLTASVYQPHGVSITEFGAVGDGATLNTKAFPNAMFYLSSFAEKGGAELFVPAGRWLTGSFNLISYLTLFLDRDAVIIGSQVR
ncbi:hypothetical protein ABZP36_005179 [Zizania latifolia]